VDGLNDDQSKRQLPDPSDRSRLVDGEMMTEPIMIVLEARSSTAC
jgi:hypothetical protein